MLENRSDTADGPTAVEARNLDVVTQAVIHWNDHDVDTLLELYCSDIVWHNAVLEETYRGHAEVRQFLAALFAGFPDLRFTVTERFARGDRVGERWLIEGTHLGPFIGIPPTGRQVAIAGVSLIEMRDGKFAKDDFFFDGMSAMRQLGIMPSLRVVRGAPGRVALRVLVTVQRMLGRQPRISRPS